MTARLMFSAAFGRDCQTLRHGNQAIRLNETRLRFVKPIIAYDLDSFSKGGLLASASFPLNCPAGYSPLKKLWRLLFVKPIIAYDLDSFSRRGGLLASFPFTSCMTLRTLRPRFRLVRSLSFALAFHSALLCARIKNVSTVLAKEESKKLKFLPGEYTGHPVLFLIHLIFPQDTCGRILTGVLLLV